MAPGGDSWARAVFMRMVAFRIPTSSPDVASPSAAVAWLKLRTAARWEVVRPQAESRTRTATPVTWLAMRCPCMARHSNVCAIDETDRNVEERRGFVRFRKTLVRRGAQRSTPPSPRRRRPADSEAPPAASCSSARLGAGTACRCGRGLRLERDAVVAHHLAAETHAEARRAGGPSSMRSPSSARVAPAGARWTCDPLQVALMPRRLSTRTSRHGPEIDLYSYPDPVARHSADGRSMTCSAAVAGSTSTSRPPSHRGSP